MTHKSPVGCYSGAPRGKGAASIEECVIGDDGPVGSDSSLGGAQIEGSMPSPSSIEHDVPGGMKSCGDDMLDHSGDDDRAKGWPEGGLPTTIS
jgi:hypothetical protein